MMYSLIRHRKVALAASIVTLLSSAVGAQAVQVSTAGSETIGAVAGAEVGVVHSEGSEAKAFIVIKRGKSFGSSMVPGDRLPFLIDGIGKVLLIRRNPTQLKDFSSTFDTEHNFQVIARGDGRRGAISYELFAYGIGAASHQMSATQMHAFVALLKRAETKIASLK